MYDRDRITASGACADLQFAYERFIWLVLFEHGRPDGDSSQLQHGPTREGDSIRQISANTNRAWAEPPPANAFASTSGVGV